MSINSGKDTSILLIGYNGIGERLAKITFPRNDRIN
jgi:hypothetical protein